MKTIIIFATLMVSCYAVEDQTSYEDTVLRPPGTPQHIHASLPSAPTDLAKSPTFEYITNSFGKFDTPSAPTNLAKSPTFEYITNSFGKFDTPSFGYITNPYGYTNYGSYVYPYVQPGGHQVGYKQIKNTGPTFSVQEKYPTKTYPTKTYPTKTYPIQTYPTQTYPTQTYPTRQTYYPRYHYEYRYFPSYIYPSYGYVFPNKK